MNDVRPLATDDGGLVDTLMADLWPLCRSITGDGTRATLRRIAREIPLTLHEVPSGTQALDWIVPEEWNLRRGILRDPSDSIVADTRDSWLHVVNYSEPHCSRLDLADLRPRLHSLPDRPEVVPYRTAYYHRTWGFCLPHARLTGLVPGTYEIEIDATLEPGSLSYGELVIPGRTRDEVLISTHVCHPSMANDNLSGICAATEAARWALRGQNLFTYRFLFVPATIGALAWLASHRDDVGHIKHGLVLSGLGDPGQLTYKRSRRGDAAVDRVMTHLVAGRGTSMDWYPYGYDERQYCSPGFDMPVGRLSRTTHGTYPEYHTSADDLSFVRTSQIVGAVNLVLEFFDVLEAGLVPRNAAPDGEPSLGRRGLYRKIGGMVDRKSEEMTFLWLLSLADGDHDLVRIATRSGIPLAEVVRASRELRESGLLEI
jgi:aminopeptidase-like protein